MKITDFAKTREICVEEFHRKMHHQVNASDPDFNLILLRSRLIAEEHSEVQEALANIHIKGNTKENRAHLLKELADLQVVLSGTAVALGLPLWEGFKRVMESNFSKFGDDGKPIYREDGKVLKGPNYKPPFLEDLV